MAAQSSQQRFLNNVFGDLRLADAHKGVSIKEIAMLIEPSFRVGTCARRASILRTLRRFPHERHFLFDYQHTSETERNFCSAPHHRLTVHHVSENWISGQCGKNSPIDIVLGVWMK